MSDFLQRFRPAGVPGAAAAAGVPADYAADQSTELDVVFSALADVRAACADMRATAEHRAGEIRERARVQAIAVASAARHTAEAERAQAAATARREADEEERAVLRAAERAADDVRARAEVRMPGEVARIVAQVRGLAGDPS
ncbi:hypothetical protein IMZ11_04035 [Microtetraspora sp. AC03309]|uniref:hypothetical protein n=1 Tax=Microtetraspora sp. AC03309 TaxID=2779376 RepID=UPI001E528439|nr:hypothetical protein [Microtetraspora sp. AC03309]MCC5574805.1 hypothetical protein [Microtetraspora sp. AC03309]